jgi:hypothetical protein
VRENWSRRQGATDAATRCTDRGHHNLSDRWPQIEVITTGLIDGSLLIEESGSIHTRGVEGCIGLDVSKGDSNAVPSR